MAEGLLGHHERLGFISVDLGSSSGSVCLPFVTSVNSPVSSTAALIQVLGTRWGQDPLARGSYSSMAVGVTGGEDYDILAESVCDRVFFAGEATTKSFPATMHGAYFTGLREVHATLITSSSKALDTTILPTPILQKLSELD